jgi:hypothetical protein
MRSQEQVLDRLAPMHDWEPDWSDVLERARKRDERRLTRIPKRGKLALVLAAVVVVLVPLAALAATNDWWLFEFGGAPQAGGTAVIVREDVWSGHAWQLVAYPSTTDGLCFAMASLTSQGAAEGKVLSCAPFVGIPRTADSKHSPDMTITYFVSQADSSLPAYIVGPVIGTASSVEVRFRDGTSLRTPTFAAPPSLGGIRFYATPLPDNVFPPPGEQPPFFGFVRSVAGLDGEGRVVACLAPEIANDGISPLKACE